MKNILFLFIAFTFAVSAHAKELSIKNLHMGMSSEEFLKLYPPKKAGWFTEGSGGSCTKIDANITRCEYTQDPQDNKTAFTIAGVQVNPDPTFIFWHDKLGEISVTFDEPDTNFDGVFQALNSKFGPPTAVEKPTLENGYGATVQDVQAIWQLPAGQITFFKYATEDESDLTLRSKAYQDELDAKEKAAHQAKKNDI